MRACICHFLMVMALAGVGFPVSADTLVLENGDVIHCEIVEWAVDHVVVEHPQLGTMRFELDQLKLDTGEPPTPGFFGTAFLRGWHRHVDLGINGEENNGSTATLTAAANLTYDDPWTRWRSDGRYFKSFSDDDNNANASLRRDWLTPESRWFGSLSGRYQFDEFQDWEHRFTLFGGPGFHVVDTDQHTLDVIPGPAFTREFGSSNANQVEAALTVTYEWTMSERQSLDLSNQFYTEVEPNAGDWRNFSTFAWSLRFLEKPAVSVNVGLQNEFDSAPEGGDNKNDLKYFLTVGVDL